MSDEILNPSEREEDISELLQIRRQKLADLQNSGNDPFKFVKYEVDSYAKNVKEDFESYEGKTVSMAGRIMSKRGMGKASFCDLQDSTGRIQLYIKIDDVGKSSYEEAKKFDIGDIAGVSGEIFKTHKGEISVKVKKIDLLCKSLRPLPEKWHGLKDMDLRYRQRYVDLIVNPDVRKTFVIRSKVIKAIREFLEEKEFLEVDTPILATIAGGATARPFITHHNTLDIDMYLRIAPELYLKRLIVGGFDKVFEIGRLFRNEGMDIKHNPEFTSMELYQAYTDYQGMMEITENMISYVAQKVLGTMIINYQGTEINLTPPWQRITMKDAIKKYVDIDIDCVQTYEDIKKIAREKSLHLKDVKTKGDFMNFLIEEYVEKNLIQPTFLCDYPVEISPLTKKKPENPELTERFEGFIYGREVCNAYSELNDPLDQRERFISQVKKREAGDEEANMMDEDFLDALEYGMPPTGGLGVGIDRIIMFLTDTYSIRDVILFPTMKPL